MNTQNQPDETNAKQPAPEEKFTPELLITLAKLTLDLCDVVVMCAPQFANSSRGAAIVNRAYSLRPKLAEMVEAGMAKRKPATEPS